MIPEWFLTLVYIFITFLMVGVVGYVTQLLVERFLISTLPVLAELYNRIKNPQDYK